MKKNDSLKYLIGLSAVVALRFIPHPPNVEPVMSSMMPFSKKWGWAAGLFFCLISIVGYDIYSGTLGVWTAITATTYALIGALAGLFFANKKSSIKNYVLFSILATLLYDAITGIGMGVFMFKMDLMTTVVGQIPFTINHVLGNIVLSSLVSPALYKWVIENPKLETSYVLGKLGFSV